MDNNDKKMITAAQTQSPTAWSGVPKRESRAKNKNTADSMT